jgi:hypothetical protein
MIGVEDPRNSEAFRIIIVRRYFKFCMLVGVTNGFGYTKFNCQNKKVDYS